VSAAAAGDDLNGLWQGAVLALQASQRGFSVVAIDIDDEKPAHTAGRNADVVVAFRPPSRHCGRVDCRVLEAMSCSRGFSARAARQNVRLALGKCQGGAQKAISGLAHVSYSETFAL